MSDGANNSVTTTPSRGRVAETLHQIGDMVTAANSTGPTAATAIIIVVAYSIRDSIVAWVFAPQVAPIIQSLCLQ